MHRERKDTTLGEIVRIRSGVSPTKAGLNANGAYPFVKVDDLNSSSKYQNVARNSTNEEKLCVTPGSILFAKRGAAIMVNKVRIADRPLALDTNMMALTPDLEKVDGEYLYYFIQREELAKIADISSIPQINNKHINPYPILLPPLTEQRKISEILRTWDEALEKLIALRCANLHRRTWFRTHLLTGRTRLPGHAEQWKTVPVSAVLTEHRQTSIGVEEVYSVSVHKGLVNQIEHLGRSFAAAETGHYNRVFPGDIVYTKSPTGNFPLGIIKRSRVDFPVIVSPLYGVFTPVTCALGVIVNTYFESPVTVRNYLHPLVQKGAKNTIAITNTRFLEGKLTLPMDAGEQAAIAEVIETSRTELELIDAEIEALVRQKRGLMQKLLTGEWRVPLDPADSSPAAQETEHSE